MFAKLDSDGRVEFPIEVELADAEGTVVAGMSVNWRVRATPSAAAPGRCGW